jgi:hypothetical protein
LACTALGKAYHLSSSFIHCQVHASRTCQAQLAPFTRLYRQCTCHCPPQLIRGPSNPWTFTCSWSTRGVDRGPAKVSEQASSTLNRLTRSRGIRDPAILLEIVKESKIHTIYRLSAERSVTLTTVTLGLVSLPTGRILYTFGTEEDDLSAHRQEIASTTLCPKSRDCVKT